MDCNDVRPGIRVRTVAKFADNATRGMLIRPDHLAARRTGAAGIVCGWVPGHGGDVWWIDHEDGGPSAAYCFTEIDPLDDAATVALLREWRIEVARHAVNAAEKRLAEARERLASIEAQP